MASGAQLEIWPGLTIFDLIQCGLIQCRTLVARRTGIGVASSCGYVLVVGQMRRHGCVRRVPVKSFALLRVASRSGPSRLRATFSSSEEALKLASVTVMLSFFVS